MHTPRKKSLYYSRKAFTMIELIIGLALGGMLLLTMTMVIGNFFSNFPLVADINNTGRIPPSPAYQMTPNAVNLQEKINDYLNDSQTSSVFILGGEDEEDIDEEFNPENQGNWDQGATANIISLRQASSRLSSSDSFRRLLLNDVQTQDAFSANAYGDDFTICILQNQDDIAAVIRSRRSDNDGITTFTVTYNDNIAGTIDSEYSYQFTIETAKYNILSEKVGVKHIWLRNLSGWGIAEELGSIVVFPDPALVPNSNIQGEKNFPAYCVFLPTKL